MENRFKVVILAMLEVIVSDGIADEFVNVIQMNELNSILNKLTKGTQQ
ncbi:MAG: hypothetical protein QME52_04590 [Bacteroidota bacterium]|nr:hypothetical protein [Bacteroidota bacterium]